MYCIFRAFILKYNLNIVFVGTLARKTLPSERTNGRMAVALNELIEKGKFLMISYRSIDSHIVLEDIRQMQALGLRLWYDVAMELGDNWKHVAENIIKHPNCAGVIFYNSENSFVSKPCFLERGWAREQAAAMNAKGEPYIYFSVNIGGRSTNEIIRDTYIRAGEGNIESVFPFEYLRDVVDMFNEDVICVRRTGTAKQTAEAIYKKTRMLGVVDDEEVVLESLAKKGVIVTEENNKVLYAGSYPREIADVDVSHRNLGKKWFTERGQQYCYLNGNYYHCEPIRFVYVGKTDAGLCFMADRVLFSPTGEELPAALDLFTKEAFRNAKKAFPVGNAELPSESAFLANKDKFDLFCKTSDFAEKQTRFWLSDRGKGGRALRMNVNESMQVNERGFNQKFKLGVRPVVTFTFNKK